MDCKNVINKLMDYIDEGLTTDEKTNIEKHIETCKDCRKELEELQNTITYLQEGNKKIVVPEKLLDNIRARLKKSNKPMSNYRRRLRTVVVLVAIMTLFVVTAVATDGFGLFNWWRQLSARESRPIYQLLEEGYGDRVNLIAIDQDIKVTVESILADDIKTVILLEIEDLKKEDLYGITRDGTEFQGSFQYDEDIPEEFRDPSFSLMTLHSEKPLQRKLLINLQPLTEKESIISLNIKELESNIVDSDKVVEGNWSFKIPVTTYETRTHKINRDLEIDGNILTIEELTVGPTATLLTYSYEHNQNKEYTLEGFCNIQLFSKGKEYLERFLSGDSSSEYVSNRKRSTRVTAEFDTMYLDDPKEVEIKVGGYEVHVKANAYKSFEIDMNKSFPQEFEYMDSKIIIESIEIGENVTEILLRESLENRNYEMLEIDFRTEGNSFVHVMQNWEEYYFIDADGTTVEGDKDNYFYYRMNMENPIIYITKNRITLEHLAKTKNLSSEMESSDEIVPTVLVIRGYKETRRVEESMMIQLR